jgi:nitronate monooxygenase
MRYPILQAPSSVAGPELVAAVAGAGGMGSFSHYRTDPETAAGHVRQVRSVTGGAFQINFVLISPPKSLDAVLDAGAPAITFSWGNPAQYVDRVKSAGVRFGIQVTSVVGAQRTIDLGADFLICQGIEAGGHVQSLTPLYELLPRVLDVSGNCPVVAAGGIGDGAAIARALRAGASGVMMGTRFVATEESRAHPRYKQRIVEAAARDAALTLCFDGAWPQASHRVLRNKTLDNWEADGSPVAGQRPGEGDLIAHSGAGAPIYRYSDTVPRADVVGDIDEMSLYAGTSCGAIADIPKAADLVERLWAECLADDAE